MKILYGTSLQDIFLKNKQEFLQLAATDSNKPLTHSKLTYRLIDTNSKRYYGFPKEFALPLERHGKLMFYMQHMANGLTDKEDQEIDNAIATIILNEKDLTKVGIRIAGLMAEKERRRNLCIHTELFYNYLAVQLVREDESVEIFDNDIQMQKVSQFKEEAKKKESTYLFFQQPEFKKLNDMLQLSPEEWNEYWQESLNRQIALKETLAVYTSATISTKAAKTGKVN